jgi:hypothetical protein
MLHLKKKTPSIETSSDWIQSRAGHHARVAEGAGYDYGKLVAVTLPPDSNRETFTDALLELGLNFEQSENTAHLHEKFLAVEVNKRSGEVMRKILTALDGTAAAVALKRVLSGDTTPLRESAKVVGVSHVAIFKQEKTIRKRLGLTESLYSERNDILQK